jgi:hypothetical protein
VRQLENDVATLQLRLMRSEDATERTTLLDQLVEYERRLGLARTGQEANRREWFEKPASLKGVQSRLRPDEMILEYVLAEPQSYCLWISPRGVGLERLSAGPKADRGPHASSLAAIRDKRSDLASSQRLYAILLSPFEKHSAASRLIIVPDGVLHLLPFETLTSATNALVLQNKVVSYAPASTVLYVLRGKPPRTSVAQKALLAVGNAPYQNQANVSAALVKSTGLKERLLRGVRGSRNVLV